MTNDERATAESIAAEVGGDLAVLLGILLSNRVVRLSANGNWYIDGRKVSDQSLRNFLDRIQAVASGRASANASDLLARRIDNQEFVRRHNVLVAAALFLASALALGSLELAAKDGATIREILRQSKYAAKFGKDIAAGKVPDVAVKRRVLAYFLALFLLFHGRRLQKAKIYGYTEARRYLTDAEHCTPNPNSGVKYTPNDCPGWAAKKWVPIHTIPPIGTLNCHQFCKCYIRYR